MSNCWYKSSFNITHLPSPVNNGYIPVFSWMESQQKGLSSLFLPSLLFSIQPSTDNHWTQTKNDHRYLFSPLESLEEVWRNVFLGDFMKTQRHCITNVLLCIPLGSLELCNYWNTFPTETLTQIVIVAVTYIQILISNMPDDVFMYVFFL